MGASTIRRVTTAGMLCALLLPGGPPATTTVMSPLGGRPATGTATGGSTPSDLVLAFSDGGYRP